MAEIFSSYVATEILKKLQSVVTDTITGAWGLKGDLKKLSDSAGRLQSLLKRVQYVAAVEDDESIKHWLEKLQKVVYAAADAVEEFHYEILRRKIELKNQHKQKLREFASCNNPIVFRVNMAVKVKQIRASLSDMEKEAPLVLLTIIIPQNTIDVEHRVVPHSQPNRMTDSFLDESERPIGRTNEVERIIEMLQARSANDVPRLSVVSIVGFGGLGKTTLAQLVFEETKKKKLFDEKMWVCVSEPFDVQKILGEMLQKLDKTTGGLTNVDVIVGNLRQYLLHKRFLLVLDDVWNEEPADWDYLKTCLGKISDKSGNFVLATTRSREVANILGTHPIHMVYLKQLPDSECWSIIRKKVVGNEGESNISHDMEIIGKEIAYKCGGVPLAAKVVGGVLSSRTYKADWLSVRDSNVWNEIDPKKRISSVLKLSFDRLPQPQKLCFACCSIFPKDVVFEKTKLIQLWMAEELLNTTSTDGGTSAKLMEDIGEEYFHCLLVNSFFQEAQVDDLGNIVRCKMHDLLHDLALSFSESGGRRMNISPDRVSEVQQILESSKDKYPQCDLIDLRCLFCTVDISPMLFNFIRLRSLDMSDCKLKNLPDEIRKLKYLRYLDVSKNDTMKELPESITKLYNLQTLRVFKCWRLQKMPSKITNLTNLRHLVFDTKVMMPLEVGCLTNLVTLPLFVVGLQKGRTIDQLGKLQKLRGELVVCGLKNVRDKGEAEGARMKEKKLSKLLLQWMEVKENEVEKGSSSAERNQEETMGGLGAPTSIESLKIEWYMGKRFSEWMHELNKLVNLTLKDCRRCEKMPTLGHLPNLRLLTVERMDSMKFIGGEFYGECNDDDTLFPSLEELYIKEMKSLVEWVSPKETKIFPKLLKLGIRRCPHLTTCPLSQSIYSASYMKLRTYDKSSVQIWCNLKSLKEVSVYECRRLTFVHVGLTNISSLSMEEDHSVKTLSLHSNELCRSSKLMILEWYCFKTVMEFPKSLETLEIDTSIDELPAKQFLELSCLKYLFIKCYNLPSIPTLSSLSSLKHLHLERGHHVESISGLSVLTSLEKLQIIDYSSLKSISSLSSLTCLKHLQITDCPRVMSIPASFRTLTCLEVLSISLCREMVSIDDDLIGSFTQLKKLEWGGFSEKLDGVPGLNSIHLLTSLQNVWIIGWDKLKSLPHQLQHLTSVTELTIQRFHGVESLPEWLCNLSSLKKLVILGCRKLKNLPTNMKCLTNLTRLEVGNCQLLRKRYDKDGPEWSNISHIQYVHMH